MAGGFNIRITRYYSKKKPDLGEGPAKAEAGGLLKLLWDIGLGD